MRDGDQMDELGRLLKARRNELGLTIEDVQNQLKFTKKAILDLEENTKSNFSDPLFFNLYLKKYAELLELDFDALVDYYDVFERTQTIKIDPDMINKRTVKKKTKKKTQPRKVKVRRSFFAEHFSKIVVAILLLLIVYFGWLYLPNLIGKDLFNQKQNNNEIEIPADNEEENEPADNEDEKDNEDENEVEPILNFVSFTNGEYIYSIENTESMELAIEFNGVSWVGVYNEDDSIIEEFTQSESVKTYQIENKVCKLNIGNHNNVKIFINGIELPYEERTENDYKILVEVK
jgi:transcriptional regulator with XRE-family HTH domain